MSQPVGNLSLLLPDSRERIYIPNESSAHTELVLLLYIPLWTGEVCIPNANQPYYILPSVVMIHYVKCRLPLFTVWKQLLFKLELVGGDVFTMKTHIIIIHDAHYTRKFTLELTATSLPPQQSESRHLQRCTNINMGVGGNISELAALLPFILAAGMLT